MTQVRIAVIFGGILTGSLLEMFYLLSCLKIKQVIHLVKIHQVAQLCTWDWCTWLYVSYIIIKTYTHTRTMHIIQNLERYRLCTVLASVLAESAKFQKLVVSLLKMEAIHLKYTYYPSSLDNHSSGYKYLNKQNLTSQIICEWGQNGDKGQN